MSLADYLRQYSNLVLAITGDTNQDPLYNRFYQIKMAGWILTQKHFEVNLLAALEAYRCINDAWIELDNYMNSTLLPVKSFDNIIKMVHVDFPFTENIITDLENNDSLIFGTK